MADYSICKKCDEFTPTDHNCFEWEFKIDDYDDEFEKRHFRTLDPEDVALKVAEEHYDGDPCDPHHFMPTISVRDSEGKVYTYDISAEAEVNFWASLKGNK